MVVRLTEKEAATVSSSGPVTKRSKLLVAEAAISSWTCPRDTGARGVTEVTP